MRLDVFITTNDLADSRTRAKNLVELGRVLVNGKVINKVPYEVKEGDVITISEDYDASLGGIKLRGVLDEAKVFVEGKKCLDVGASNGGFCDVLLQKGAKSVIALDIGECALPQRLKDDPRIIVMDRKNARTLLPSDLPYSPDLITVDVSFISLTQVLPALNACLADNGVAVCLIKPQFECGKKALSKKGIVTDKREEKRAIEKITSFSSSIGLSPTGVFAAPHPFEKKNQEYFIILVKNIA